MPTFEQMFYLREAGWWPRARRNFRLLRFLAGIVWTYWTVGRRLRAELRRQEAGGGTIWLDGEQRKTP